jgi:hypothetical protein
MTIAKLLVSLFLIGVGQTALANNWYDRGNGGFVLSCGEQPLMVLDVYEAQKRYYYPVVFSDKTEVVDKAEDILSRLSKIDPVRARLYTDWLKNFYQESQILIDTEFMETPDLGLVKKPMGCTLEQVIFQREPSRISPARYIINEKIWNRLDKDNQAALIIHELIYRDFLSGMSLESTSERIRLFNAMILGNKIAPLSLQEYIRILQEDLHLSAYTYNGITLFLGATDTAGRWRSAGIEFHDSDKISQGRFAANQIVKAQDFSYFCMSSDDVPNGGSVSFAPNGKIQGLRMSPALEENPLCAYPSLEVKAGNKTISVSGSSWTFDENGKVNVVTGTTAKEVYSHMEYKGMEYERKITLGLVPAVETYFRFDGEGRLRELSLGGRPCILRDMSLVRFEPNADSRVWTVQIDKAGELESKLSICDY